MAEKPFAPPNIQLALYVQDDEPDNLLAIKILSVYLQSYCMEKWKSTELDTDLWKQFEKQNKLCDKRFGIIVSAIAVLQKAYSLHLETPYPGRRCYLSKKMFVDMTADVNLPVRILARATEQMSHEMGNCLRDNPDNDNVSSEIRVYWHKRISAVANAIEQLNIRLEQIDAVANDRALPSPSCFDWQKYKNFITLYLGTKPVVVLQHYQEPRGEWKIVSFYDKQYKEANFAWAVAEAMEKYPNG